MMGSSSIYASGKLALLGRRMVYGWINRVEEIMNEQMKKLNEIKGKKNTGLLTLFIDSL